MNLPVLALLLLLTTLAHTLPYTTKYFPQKIDHFNFQNNAKYNQRYLYNDKHWGTNPSFQSEGCKKGPIFFYTGNESPVDLYYPAAGHFTEVQHAQSLTIGPRAKVWRIINLRRAPLLWGEYALWKTIFRQTKHWLPINTYAISLSLTIEQALADYANMIDTMFKRDPDLKDCPVFAFGGSYGGMLTAWFRLKYPGLVMGGLAASAPLAWYDAGRSPYVYTEAATNTFETSRPGCGDKMKAAFEVVESHVKSAHGRAILSEKFKLCKPLTSESEGEYLLSWLSDGLSSEPMLDYPYPTNYGTFLPAWPCNRTCDAMFEHADLLDAFAAGAGVYFNGSGDVSCYNLDGSNPDGTGWPYLFCTETYLPQGSNGLFPYKKYNVQDDIDYCKSEFGVQLDPYWQLALWGNYSVWEDASHIIFSNGLLDPWHPMGVLETVSDTVIAIVIPESAHHFDLRGPNPADPIPVQKARIQEANIIHTWMVEYFKNL